MSERRPLLVTLLALSFALALALAPTSARAQTVRIAAAGDIACAPGVEPSAHTCKMDETAELIVREAPDAVLALGDLQYPDGSYEAFTNAFDRSWGRFRELIRPAAGNHEYHTPGAEGYFSYFGAAAGPSPAGYYSFDLGAWHLIALNSNCDQVGGCGPGSPQLEWLQRDLASNPARCTLAFWHHPRFSDGPHGDNDEVAPLWQALADAGAELILAGHDHLYQRFAPQDAGGRRDPEGGVRAFVVGTGGSRHYPFARHSANREVGHSGAFGVLLLDLEPAGYRWRFAAVGGSGFSDDGEGACR